MAVPAPAADPITVGVIDPHQPADPVVHDIAAGNLDRSRINVARPHPAPQKLRRGDRQDPGAGANIERAGDPPPRQNFERHEAALGRRMLAGAKSGRGIECDPDRPGRHPAAKMRAVDKKAADAQRRKSELVFGEPVAINQRQLRDLDQLSAIGRSGECQTRR